MRVWSVRGMAHSGHLQPLILGHHFDRPRPSFRLDEFSFRSGSSAIPRAVSMSSCESWSVAVAAIIRSVRSLLSTERTSWFVARGTSLTGSPALRVG